MIAFAAPWVLAGLGLAALPLLLHLFARREPPTVDFPAVRYLAETARAHQRRLHVQHWLLLALRTLLILLIVLAAAGPSLRAGGRSHAPTALVLILDNSLSSGVTAGGTPLIEPLRAAAAAVLDRATADDALWLLTTDGPPRRSSAPELRAVVDSVVPSPRRLDLGQAVALARGILADQPLPREVVVLTDLQATALSPAPGGGRVTVARPGSPPVGNLGIAGIDAGPQPWTADGGVVTIRLAGTDTLTAPVSVTLGDRPPRQALGTPSRPAAVTLPGARRGWLPLTVELAPDELRLDDRWTTAIRVAPPARVRWDPADRYVNAALDVLRDGGRIQSGGDVTFGALGGGASVVLPPVDPARLGALNRGLAARGVSWRYGAQDVTPTVTDSGPVLDPERVLRRQLLEPVGAGPGEILVRAGGEPWVVRSGDVVLLGSRLDPAWTGLPLSARFVPFLDALLNRLVRGEIAALAAAPGDPVVLPERVDALAQPGGRVPVEGGATWHPTAPGVHYLLRGADTVGVLSVNPDPRESDLGRAADATVRALWGDVRLVALDDVSDEAFQAAGRGDLRAPLLWLALLVGLTEAGLAAWRRRPS
jgi:hypothetical protein